MSYDDHRKTEGEVGNDFSARGTAHLPDVWRRRCSDALYNPPGGLSDYESVGRRLDSRCGSTQDPSGNSVQTQSVARIRN